MRVSRTFDTHSRSSLMLSSISSAGERNGLFQKQRRGFKMERKQADKPQLTVAAHGADVGGRRCAVAADQLVAELEEAVERVHLHGPPGGPRGLLLRRVPGPVGARAPAVPLAVQPRHRAGVEGRRQLHVTHD